ncbi:MAG: hypothetical protein IJL32_06520 [Oscillospiraceae bacterium]|nr:hypothetical protein [Oscillospiraceae bacterium]
MEKYRMTTVGALLTNLRDAVLRSGETVSGEWCMYTAGDAAYTAETPCYPADYPAADGDNSETLPADALQHGMCAYVSDELLCDVVSEMLSRGEEGDAQSLTESLNYYLAHDCFPPQSGCSLARLDQLLRSHQWQNGLQLPRRILSEPACDLSIALEIFYLAGGYHYLENDSRALGTEEMAFLHALHGRIVSGAFRKSTRHYQVPLTKIQRYKLERKQIPVVFLTDL